MLLAFRTFLVAVAVGCALLLFVHTAALFPAVAEEPVWQEAAARPSSDGLQAYLDACLGCLHTTAARGAIDHFERAAGRVSVWSDDPAQGSSGQVRQVGVAPGGQVAASVVNWSQLITWQLASGLRTRLIDVRTNDRVGWRHAVVMADGRLASASDEAVVVWGPSDDSPALSLALPSPVTPADSRPELIQLRASPSAPQLAWLTERGGGVWHTGTGRTMVLDHEGAEWLAFDGAQHVVTLSGTELRRWRVDIGELDSVAEAGTHGRAMGLSLDGRHAYVATIGALEVRDTRRGALVRTLVPGEAEPTRVCAGDATGPVVIGTAQGELLVMGTDDPTPAARWRAHPRSIDVLACAPGTRMLVSVGAEGHPAKVWDLDAAIGAASEPPAALPAGWNVQDDWRQPWVDRLVRWRVDERLPWLGAWFDTQDGEVLAYGVGGLFAVVVLWQLVSPGRGGRHAASSRGRR